MRLIALTQGKFAQVDEEDFAYLSQWTWCAHKEKKRYYAISNERRDGKNVQVKMHRVLLSAAKGQLVDHRDGDGLNNQRDNIRFCTKSTNGFNKGAPRTNTSGFKGVLWDKRMEKWYSVITVNQKSIYLGSFVDKLEAAKAYDTAARRLHGQFAHLNLPDNL